jgi:hypothetical protein
MKVEKLNSIFGGSAMWCIDWESAIEATVSVRFARSLPPARRTSAESRTALWESGKARKKV